VITASALSSHITAATTITLGPGSTVIGSTLRAQTGVIAFNIGAPGAASSEIYLGIDFRVDARLAKIRDQTVALTGKLQKIRLALQHGSSRQRQLEQLEFDIRSAIARLAEEAGQLVSILDRDDEVELEVRGTIYAGTYVEICHRSYLVEHTTGRCRFRIDKSRGCVVQESISKSRSED
jgi:hypothetical protein